VKFYDFILTNTLLELKDRENDQLRLKFKNGSYMEVYPYTCEGCDG
jgi:hypothetical protein